MPAVGVAVAIPFVSDDHGGIPPVSAPGITDNPGVYITDNSGNVITENDT